MDKFGLSERIEKLKNDSIELLKEFEKDTGLPIKLIAESVYDIRNSAQYYCIILIDPKEREK